jgi:hypothetical protein
MAEFDLHLDGRVMSASFPKLRRLGVGKTKQKIYTDDRIAEYSCLDGEQKKKKKSTSSLAVIRC